MDFTKWLDRSGGSPREMTERKRIRSILGMEKTNGGGVINFVGCGAELLIVTTVKTENDTSRQQRNRRDHYVPQGYLRGFIDPARMEHSQPL